MFFGMNAADEAELEEDNWPGSLETISVTVRRTIRPSNEGEMARSKKSTRDE